jgi:hypothetical protein
MKRSGMLRDEKGQGYVEFLVVLPALILLAVFVAVSFWAWWNQGIAALAVDRGTAWAARRDGSLERGYQETREMLEIGLGRSAAEYEGYYTIVYMPPMRATAGYLSRPLDTLLGLFQIKATAFHRRELFYGGPPGYFE